MTSGEYITGIVLARKNQGDFDTIISVYSKEHGKVEVKIRSARKIISKLAPLVAEPFVLVKLKVVKGKQYYHLIGGEVQERFENIYKDYIKMNSIANVFSSINEVVKFRRPDLKIFSLLIAFLQKANKAQQQEMTILIPAFLIKLLAFLGYRPQIRECTICQTPLPLPGAPLDLACLYFDFDLGGIVCKKHKYDSEGRTELFVSTLIILQNLLYKKFDNILRQKYSKKNIQSAEKIINQFYQWQVD